jgi:hypothetical protein
MTAWADFLARVIYDDPDLSNRCPIVTLTVNKLKQAIQTALGRPSRGAPVHQFGPAKPVTGARAANGNPAPEAPSVRRFSLGRLARNKAFMHLRKSDWHLASRS